jgi:hypothetical protein
MNFPFSDLPMDIINQIIPYTYLLQSKELLEDIRSYYISKKSIEDIYFNIFFDDYFVDDKVDKSWLINDLFAFANDYNPTMFGFVDSFYDIFSRNRMLKKDFYKINNFIGLLENNSIEKQINIFWGLFTPEERNDFIDIANMKIRIIN